MKKLDIKLNHFQDLESIMDREQGVCKCPIVCVSQQPSWQPNWLDPWSCDVVYPNSCLMVLFWSQNSEWPDSPTINVCVPVQ